MEPDNGTTNELKMSLIEHFATLLDDLEMNDGNESGMTDAAIVDMHERNIDIAGFLLGSLGLSEASKDDNGYLVRVNPAEPHTYVDAYLS